MQMNGSLFWNMFQCCGIFDCWWTWICQGGRKKRTSGWRLKQCWPFHFLRKTYYQNQVDESCESSIANCWRKKKTGKKFFDRLSRKAGRKKRWCKNWVSWGERQTLSFVIARTQDNSTAIIFCNVLLKQVPAPPVSFQWKQRVLSHQITSHLNTHIVRISQINLIRILLPGVPPGCNQLHCIWIKLTSCCHSKVSLDCCTLWSSLVSKQCLR